MRHDVRMQISNNAHRRAFTLIELSVVILVVAIVIAAVFFLWLPSLGKSAGPTGRRLKDSSQIRSVVQAMVTSAGYNRDGYPLPSKLDTKDATVSEVGEAKNTSANILSLLIYNGHISPEILLSTDESNPNIEIDTDHQLSNPAAAVRPADALWDPAFNADFTDPNRKGNLSYAHLLPAGLRLEQWKDTFSSTEAVFGNRGPRFQGTTYPTSGRWVLTDDKFGTGSNTLAIHGGRSTWEGNIGYNDGHVSFETKPNPETVTYQRSVAGQAKPAPTSDNLFVDETDDSVGTNVFMSIFKSAGPDARQFESIWD